MRKSRILLANSILAITLAACTTVKETALEIQPMDASVHVSEKENKLTEQQQKKWSHADLQQDGIPGISLDKAYNFLAGKKAEKVIVGVIDSGIDIDHEDLRDVLWVNPDDIPSNNVDDDHNGYVDDVYGWNFLGGNGEEAPEQFEITRLYSKYKKMFAGKQEKDFTDEEKADYKKYKLYKQAYEDASSEHNNTSTRLQYLDGCFEAVAKALKNEDFTQLQLDTTTFSNPTLTSQANSVRNLFELGYDKASFYEYYNEHKKTKHYDLEFNGRAIVGDDPSDISFKQYGNSIVTGAKSSESHGTHVAGIILANRDNGIGIRGIANHARLMAIRAIPDGDERDKDVALAIRYAVDNGAKVINMSFGKGWSPYKQWVYDAIKYAARHDVLLVHAAGNSSENIDFKANYPNDSDDLMNEIADNFISVGAIGSDLNANLLAPFSNYGKKNVDIFAPGVQIYSSVPNNGYDKFSGTSMAAPHVSGVAALVRSYYPQLSAKEVKQIILGSGIDLDMQEIVPGHISMKKRLYDLSVSGRILNAYNAVVLADKVINSTNLVKKSKTSE